VARRKRNGRARGPEITSLVLMAQEWALKAAGGRKPWSGEITCPRCGHRLGAIIDKGGNVRGCCETADCLWW